MNEALSASSELLESLDDPIAVSSDALAEPVVRNMLLSSELVSAEPLVASPDCQPTTTAAVAPTPTAMKSTRSTPTTYIKYLNGGESALSHSIISSPALRPVEYILVARGRKVHSPNGLSPWLRKGAK